ELHHCDGLSSCSYFFDSAGPENSIQAMSETMRSLSLASPGGGNPRPRFSIQFEQMPVDEASQLLSVGFVLEHRFMVPPCLNDLHRASENGSQPGLGGRQLYEVRIGVFCGTHQQRGCFVRLTWPMAAQERSTEYITLDDSTQFCTVILAGQRLLHFCQHLV